VPSNSHPLFGDESGWCWTSLFARLMLGTLFLVPAWHKVFVMGPMTHARQLFVEGFSEHWIPAWLLGPLGVAIPFLELAVGALLIVGLWIRPALVTVGAILVTVTYGHLLQEPFFDVTTHIVPRAALLFLLLLLPARLDRWSADQVLRRRASR